MMAAVSSLCATLLCLSVLKNCPVALVGLGSELELGLGSVLVYRVRVRLGVMVLH